MRLKLFPLALAAVLALGLAGCGTKDAAGSSSAPSSSPAGSSASSEADSQTEEDAASSQSSTSKRPQSGTVTIVVEGEEEELPVTLFEGEGYSIYLPEGEWTHTEAGDGSQVQDVFAAVENDKVLLAIQSSGEESATLDQVYDALLEEGYLQSDDDDQYFALSEDGVVTCQYIVEGTDGQIWYISWCYPDTTEYVEGWGSRIPQLIETFEAE